MTAKPIGKLLHQPICWAILFILISLGLTSCAPEESFLSGPPRKDVNGDQIGPSKYNQFSQDFEEPWPFGRGP